MGITFFDLQQPELRTGRENEMNTENPPKMLHFVTVLVSLFLPAELPRRNHRYYNYLQVALLWQRDRATRLSVEILQLQKIPFEN